MLVTKRNGTKQKLDLDKIHAVLAWACDGKNDDALEPISGVSVSQIELNANLHLYDGIQTSDIHKILIKSAADLISEETPNYDHVAARLVWFAVRKVAFNNNLPPHLKTIIEKNIARGVYTPEILELYSDDEINTINGFIDHRRDDLFRYAGAIQMSRKYLAQNRKTKEVYESFQIPYILVAALLFAKYPKETRLDYVKKYYDAISMHDISEPTPIMAGVRTKIKQFSSCTLIESGDSLDSITATSKAIVEYASRKAGIGVGIGRIRAAGQPVRNGDAVTTGVLPFAKLFNAALKSCSQGAIRGAAATFNYPVWHLEFQRLIELKNNKGTEETRLRTVDYCIHLNEVFYERFVFKKNITFFSPEEVPDLYDAFYSPDVKKFRLLYEMYEADPTKTKIVLPAVDVFTKIAGERFETNRIYIMNADLVNKQTGILEPIRMTNLCVEVTQHTQPMGEDDALVALCTLAAINVGKLIPNMLLSPEKQEEQDKRLAEICRLTVRGLDALLDYQDYPLEEARRHTMRYRPLGIGVIGYAHWLATAGLKWGSDEAIAETEKLFEAIAYHLTDASIELAQELGPCVHTRYHDGIFPMDLAAKPPVTTKDWESLRVRAKKYGIRNATLMALMPSETSSQLANETNGIEPPMSPITIKDSKDGVPPLVVPEYASLKWNYQYVWDIEASDYLRTTAAMQKYVDQAISLNTSYDPAKENVTLSKIISDILLAYKLGHKNLYYQNTLDDAIKTSDDASCEGGGCKI